MVGQFLKTAREAAGLTQEAVAANAGVDRAYLSLLENDKKSPTLNTLFLICNAIGVKPSEIIAQVEDAQERQQT